MTTKSRLPGGLLLLCTTLALALIAMSGIAVSSASASVCLKVDPSEEANFKESNCTGGIIKNGYSSFEPGLYTLKTPNLLCAKVLLSNLSNWSNSGCTVGSIGKGEYTLISTRCNEINGFKGQGSSLQKIAQQNVWVPGANCGASYESTGSGAGRKAWGVEAGENRMPLDGSKKTPGESGDTFIGSDEPFTANQITNLDLAAGGTEQTLVIPVLQAAVAMVVHPPAGCEPHEITNKSLLEVWNGTAKKWSSIKPTPAGGANCEKAITRVVRQDSSGTTFVFKTYLREIEEAGLAAPCNKSWKEMAEPANNLTWPETGKEGCTGLTEVVRPAGSGGGEVVAKVKSAAGLLGYANLGDARGSYTEKELEWLKVQNNGVKESTPSPTYANPGTAAKEPGGIAAAANCVGTNYGSLPAATADDNLSELNGAHPSATNYPICTLTYDIALMNYNEAHYGGPNPEMELGLPTKEYLEYVTGSGAGEGQEAIAETHDYDKLPEKIQHFSHLLALLVN